MKTKPAFGHSIRSLQIMLRTLQFTRQVPCTVVADGIYGPHTLEAVTDFQRTHALPVTGITDAETWNKIAADYENASVDTCCACPLRIALSPGERICSGSRHPHTALIQSILMLLNQQFRCTGDIKPTGIWDQQTADAIFAFQKTAGLECTGELNKQTWKHLALQYPLAVSRRMKEYPEYS